MPCRRPSSITRPSSAFCTPGRILGAHALLKKAPKQGCRQVAEALDGNLCRCGSRQQVEGRVTMVLSHPLSEEIRFKNGQVLDEHFDTDGLPRFTDMPTIETILIHNPNLSAQGGGEPAIVVMGALIANAIHDAIGMRMLQMPMRLERIREALKA